MIRDTPAQTGRVVLISITIGMAISALLLWLLYFRSPSSEHESRLLFLPTTNALCNAASALCLLAGLRAIQLRNVRLHMSFMLTALMFSALFLAGYLTHHALHGDTPFTGDGTVRVVYLTILASHVLLSIVVMPAILTTLYFALAGRFVQHRRLARYTLPAWLYVSVTGVIVYLMLRTYG